MSHGGTSENGTPRQIIILDTKYSNCMGIGLGIDDATGRKNGSPSTSNRHAEHKIRISILRVMD